jgi:hypothetical protein
MNKRHPFNPNLFLHEGDHWNGLPVQTHCGPLIVNYLERINETVGKALCEHPRTAVMRFDLRVPMGWPEMDTEVISRFTASLKAQLLADSHRKEREGKRVHPCTVRYVWARERVSSEHSHYHVAIFLNRDAYFTLGRFRANRLWGDDDTFLGEEEGAVVNMADRINHAWASALGCNSGPVPGLVHFPENPVYSIIASSPCCGQQIAEVFYRLSYLAKADTKHYGGGVNSFRCSVV